MSGTLHQQPPHTLRARSLCEDLLCKMSVSRSPQQNPVGPLAHDLCIRISCAYLCVRISASASCMTTCARSLYANLLCKISLSGCLHQDPVGPIVQDLCMRISCPRSLFQDLCALVQDLCMWISCARSLSGSASRSCRTSCARSLSEDLLYKMSVSRFPQQDPVGALVQDRCMRISCARCLCPDLLRIL